MTINLAPAFAAACAFSSKPPTLPESFVTKYLLLYLFIISILSNSEKGKKSIENSKAVKPSEIYEFRRQIKKVVISGPRLERTSGISLRSRVSNITSYQRDQLEQNNRITRIPQNRVRRTNPTQAAIRIAQAA